jgi:hypothetical protein
MGRLIGGIWRVSSVVLVLGEGGGVKRDKAEGADW